MRIIKAESAGFCFGVDNAVSAALRTAENNHNKNIATLGELIHNSYVVDQLSKKGVTVSDDIASLQSDIAIVRSHGIGKEQYAQLQAKKIEIIDATCPYVKSIQNKVEKYYKKGYTVIIVGDKSHPEVIGVNGWCENSASIINSMQEARQVTSKKPICVVAQTTIIKSLFDQIVDIIKLKYPETIVFNTICSATTQRQQEAVQIASQVEAMFVIGSHNSSNTKKLVEICKEKCSNVYHIEDVTDLNTNMYSKCDIVGVTAGASSPAQIILEVIKRMDNTLESFEKSIEELKQLKPGDIISGEIILVNENEVYLNIGYKSDGIIRKNDFLLDLYSDLTTTVAVGDQVEAMILDMNDGMGNVVLSKIKVDEIIAYQEAEEKFNAKETLEGKITKIVKGGMIVDIGFTKAFMPANQYELKYTEDLNALLGQEITGRIIEFDKEKNRIIFSRKVIMQEELNALRAEQAKQREAALAELDIDVIAKGPIKNVTDFGIFIDLGGVDGFIHVSDLSWGRVSSPKAVCKVGDEVEAKVIEIDKEKGKVKLSLKAMTKEPWTAFLDEYKVGDVVDVKIKNIAKFGAFAEIIPSVEGLIHISNLSHEKVDKVESVIKTNDEVKAKIIDIDKDKRKIGLSIKDLTEAPKKKIEADKLFYKEESNATMAEAFKKFLQ